MWQRSGGLGQLSVTICSVEEAETGRCGLRNRHRIEIDTRTVIYGHPHPADPPYRSRNTSSEYPAGPKPRLLHGHGTAPADTASVLLGSSSCVVVLCKLWLARCCLPCCSVVRADRCCPASDRRASPRTPRPVLRSISYHWPGSVVPAPAVSQERRAPTRTYLRPPLRSDLTLARARKSLTPLRGESLPARTGRALEGRLSSSFSAKAW